MHMPPRSTLAQRLFRYSTVEKGSLHFSRASSFHTRSDITHLITVLHLLRHAHTRSNFASSLRCARFGSARKVSAWLRATCRHLRDCDWATRYTCAIPLSSYTTSLPVRVFAAARASWFGSQISTRIKACCRHPRKFNSS